MREKKNFEDAIFLHAVLIIKHYYNNFYLHAVTDNKLNIMRTQVEATNSLLHCQPQSNNQVIISIQLND